MDVDGSLRDTWIRETNKDTTLILLQQCSAGVFSLLVFIVRLLHHSSAEILITSACSSVLYWKCIFRILQGKIRHRPIKKESNIFMDFAAFGLFCQVCLTLKLVRMRLIISVTLFGTIYWRISYSKLAHLTFYIYTLENSVRCTSTSSQYTQLAQKGNFEKDLLTLAGGSKIYLKI